MRQRFIQSFPTSEDIQSALDNKELGKPYVALSREEPSIDWNSKEIDYTGMPLTFEIISGGTIGLIGHFNTITNYEYQINGGEIVTGQAAGNAYTNISLNAGDVIKIRGFKNTQNGGLSVNPDADLVFNIYGNVASLGSALVSLKLAGKHVISAENLVMLDPNFSCSNLFSGCTDLITAPELPATTLKSYYYSNMFAGCTSLTKAPELPATTLANNCYAYMFRGCTSLKQSPVLPATTLASNCYDSMFSGCKNLTQAPELPATKLASYCYAYMFQDCTSLTTAPELPATELVENCYKGMFQGCTSLTTAPELPATTLANYCYSHMFQGCTSLTTAPELPAITLANWCYEYMFYDCDSLTQAPELPAITLAASCYSSMFGNCGALTTAPELPATELVDYCYNSMFIWSKNLNYIKCLATDISAANCTGSWLLFASTSGTFVKHPDATWTTGYDGIPKGWTVEDAVI